MSGPMPPAAEPSPTWYRRAGLGFGLALTGALVYVGLVDPHRPDSVFPVCPFRLLTGLTCPGCGTLRMIHDVLHGDLAAAVNDNVLVLVGVPLLVGWILIRRRSGKWPLTLPVAATVLVTLISWTVVRNLPGFPLVPTMLTR